MLLNKNIHRASKSACHININICFFFFTYIVSVPRKQLKNLYTLGVTIALLLWLIN